MSGTALSHGDTATKKANKGPALFGLISSGRETLEPVKTECGVEWHMKAIEQGKKIENGTVFLYVGQSGEAPKDNGR